jgi:hypothetical protein
MMAAIVVVTGGAELGVLARDILLAEGYAVSEASTLADAVRMAVTAAAARVRRVDDPWPPQR